MEEEVSHCFSLMRSCLTACLPGRVFPKSKVQKSLEEDISVLHIDKELSYSYSLRNSCPNITHGGGAISPLHIEEDLLQLHTEK